MLSLLTYKHGICFHLGSLVSFISILKFSAYKFCFIWFTYPYLIFWDIKNEIVFLISISMCSLLVYRNTFFIGYPACWELNGIMSLFKEDFYLGFFGGGISSVQVSRSVVSDSLWPHGSAALQASLSITSSRSSPKLMSIESSHLILCHLLLLLPSIFPSTGVFSNESALCITWSKYWRFSFNISPSDECLGLISFTTDWLDILAIQGTLKSLLQHHSWKASILCHSAYFTVQLSHPYMTTGKTIALTRRTFVGKVMSLLLNMLSRLVITFLPRSKRLFISWLQSPSAVILEH